ncbi:4-hydroxy-3-methylbut-2-enyl diphosphate reductase [Candidatus Saganbacteria bacterium]|nr:4-hydroxy-3-methylbut-2-enyl diphosphate reductase [Candidatus Saganbacteria bacterium]
MEILIAEHAGFCEGVERAYQIALEQTIAKKPVYMLGNLVHNTQVVEKLKNLGVKTVNNLSEVPLEPKGILIISAHGVTPKTYEDAKALGYELIDTTCPWVKNAQRLAKNLSEKGLTIVIIGDKEHPEVRGILGWANNKAFVVQSPTDLNQIPDSVLINGVGVVAQTTQSEANFDSVVSSLKVRTKNVIAHKTICGATSKRQGAAVELAKKVDLMLVIGDTKSANTKRLTELCKKTGTETFQIQTAKELDKNWFKNKEKLGITAGASTPEWVMDEVINLLQAQ